MGEGSWRRHMEVESQGIMRIRKHGKMQVDAMIVSNPEHMNKSTDDRSISQLINTASMPGVVGEAWLWQTGILDTVSQ